MKTTTPTLLCQSYQTWRETIRQELAVTREHIAAIEMTTAIWRNENPRCERCERSWA